MASDSQILVAESNSIIATDIQCLLTNWGFNPPDITNSADKTFERIKHRQPDLIVMGTQLRDNHDCLRLATWINKTYKNLPSSMENHVTSGHVSLFVRWEYNKTVIILECKRLKSLGIITPNTELHYYFKPYYESLQQPQPNPDTKNL